MTVEGKEEKDMTFLYKKYSHGKGLNISTCGE